MPKSDPHSIELGVDCTVISGPLEALKKTLNKKSIITAQEGSDCSGCLVSTKAEACLIRGRGQHTAIRDNLDHKIIHAAGHHQLACSPAIRLLKAVAHVHGQGSTASKSVLYPRTAPTGKCLRSLFGRTHSSAGRAREIGNSARR